MHQLQLYLVTFCAALARANFAFPFIPKPPGSQFEFPFHPYSSAAPYYDQYEPSPSQQPNIALTADMVRSLLAGGGQDIMALPMGGSASGPIAFTIPIKAKRPAKNQKLQVEATEDIVYGSRQSAAVPPPTTSSTPTQTRRIRIKALRVPATEGQRSPALILVESAPSTQQTRPRFESNSWLPVDNSRPRTVVVPALVPTIVRSRAAQQPASTAEPIRFKSGIHELQSPRLAESRPAHLPAATEDLPPRPKNIHPAFQVEHTGVQASGFSPMIGPPKTHYPREPMKDFDYGTDIITIYDVAKKQKDPSLVKVVQSSIQVKPAPNVQQGRGEVFDDVVYDQRDGSDYKPAASQLRPSRWFKLYN